MSIELEWVLKYFFIALWLFIFITMILIEIFTTGIWSGITAAAVLPSLVIASSTKPVWWIFVLQVGLFLVLWIVLYFSLYKVLKRYFNKTVYKGPIYEMIDGEAIALLEDSYEAGDSKQKYGILALGDKKYRTISLPGQGIIFQGEYVVVKEIKGNILYITRKENKK